MTSPKEPTPSIGIQNVLRLTFKSLREHIPFLFPELKLIDQSVNVIDEVAKEEIEYNFSNVCIEMSLVNKRNKKPPIDIFFVVDMIEANRRFKVVTISLVSTFQKRFRQKVRRFEKEVGHSLEEMTIDELTKLVDYFNNQNIDYKSYHQNECIKTLSEEYYKEIMSIVIQRTANYYDSHATEFTRLR